VALAILAPMIWGIAAILPGWRSVRAFGRRAARLVLRLTGCRLSVEGLEHLPRDGRCVLVANHTSYADMPALMALLPIDFAFVAKREVLSWPLIGTFVRKGRHPTVHGWGSPESVVDAQQIRRMIREGDAVLFFPEGTFGAAAGLRPFRLGAFDAAAVAEAPVVPIAIRGARSALRGDDILPRPGPIHVWVGKPIVADGQGRAAVISLRDRTMQAIAEHCGEPRLDLVAAAPVAR
jgi:1-acyl-sn-glycerol-3-phosphate acyltransferase